MAYALSPSHHPAPLDLDKQNYTETFFSRRIQQQEAPFPGRCLFADEASNDEEADRVPVPRARRYGPGAMHTASPRSKQDVTSIALEGGLSPSIAPSPLPLAESFGPGPPTAPQGVSRPPGEHRQLRRRATVKDKSGHAIGVSYTADVPLNSLHGAHRRYRSEATGVYSSSAPSFSYPTTYKCVEENPVQPTATTATHSPLARPPANNPPITRPHSPPASIHPPIQRPTLLHRATSTSALSRPSKLITDLTLGPSPPPSPTHRPRISYRRPSFSQLSTLTPPTSHSSWSTTSDSRSSASYTLPEEPLSPPPLEISAFDWNEEDTPVPSSTTSTTSQPKMRDSVLGGWKKMVKKRSSEDHHLAPSRSAPTLPTATVRRVRSSSQVFAAAAENGGLGRNRAWTTWGGNSKEEKKREKRREELKKAIKVVGRGTRPEDYI